MSSSETFIDNYRLWVEDDVLCLRASGPMTSAIVDWLVVTVPDLLSRHAHYYILADLIDAGAISPELRRRIVEFTAAHPPRAIAFFHVGLIAKGVNALLLGALNLFSKRKQLWLQCNTEGEARAWLNEQRPGRHHSAAHS
ncbi:MAG: hypothetical protein JNJ46_15595 [Myxococcales bacterium]|nr:hypothetical protein [Myxococcales bacterium]